MEKEKQNQKGKVKSNNTKLNKNNKDTKKVETKKKPIFFDKTLITFIVESLYIFILEVLFKIIFGSFSIDWNLLRIFISSILLGLAITTCTFKLKNVPRKIILICFNCFFAFYAWLQMGFVDFLGNFMSMGNAEQGTKITDFILDFLLAYKFKSHLLYLPFILTILYFVFEKKILKDSYDKKIETINKKFVAIVIVSACLLLDMYAVSIVAKFMQSKYQTVSNKELFKYPSNPSEAIKNYGISVYFVLDLKSTILGSSSIEEYTINKKEQAQAAPSKARDINDELWDKVIEKTKDSSLLTLHNYYKNRTITEKNEYTGLFKDKNLIMIMLESVSFSVLDEKYKDYFPTLYKLQSEGISSINNYSPKNNCPTGESEMTSQLSLYSIETTCTVNTYKKNVYPEALLSMLKNAGYYTSSYHDYTDQYYSRSVFEKNVGAIDYFGVTDLDMKYNPVYKEWPSDVVFMEKALPKFIDKEKFASYMITVTPHSPYMYNSEFGNMYVSLFDDLDVDQTTKRYLSKVKVTDLALEYLLSTLEEKGILDDTVIVLFGDHYPYALNQKQFASITSYDTNINQDKDKTPFIIYNSKTPHETITKYTSPLDYAPTILNLFDIDYDPRFYLGNDIFSEYDDFVLFPDNSWQNSKGFYNVAKGEFIPNVEGDLMSDEDIIYINTLTKDLRNMSNLTIKKNYFDYLYKAIEKEKQELLNTTEDMEEKDEEDSDSRVTKQDKDN